ncbi:MAG: carbohydrate binding family 6, partial [Acidimicrobiaceae bacterium]
YLKVSQSTTVGTVQPRYEYAVRASETAIVARVSGSNTSGAANLTVTFSNSSIGALSTYLWDFGDGTTSTSASPQRIYTSPGNYVARLTVNGSYLSNALDVTVTGTPAADHASSAGGTQDPRDTLVVDGPPMTGYLTDEYDWFRVAVTASTTYAVDVLQGTLHGAEVRVYSPSDLVNAIAINYRPSSDYTRAAHAVFTPGQTNTYYVRVVRNTGPAGSYSVRTRTVSSLPNLKVTALSGPSSLAVSLPGDFWVTVSNPTSQAVTQPFTVALGAGNNTDFDTTARYVKERTFGDGVAANSSVTIPVRAWFPPSMTGSKKLFAIVNRAFTVAETDYDDNLLQQGTVSIAQRSRPPRVTAGSEKSAASGSQVALSAVASDPEGGALGYSWRQLS